MYLALTDEWITGELTEKQHRKFAKLSLKPDEYVRARSKSGSHEVIKLILGMLMIFAISIYLGSAGYETFAAISLTPVFAGVCRMVIIGFRLDDYSLSQAHNFKKLMVNSKELRYLRRTIDSSRFISPTKHDAFQALAEADGLSANPSGVRTYLSRYAAYVDEINAYLSDSRVQSVVMLMQDVPDHQYWTPEITQAYFALALQLGEYAQECKAAIDVKQVAAANSAHEIDQARIAIEASDRELRLALVDGSRQAWLTTVQASQELQATAPKQLSS